MNVDTAIHEAGHVIARLVWKCSFHYVTVIPDRLSNGHVGITAAPNTILRSTSRTLNEACALLAGTMAQAVFDGKRFFYSGCESDVYKAAFLLSKKSYSLHHAMSNTFTLCHLHRTAIEVLAGALLTEKRLTAAEVRRMDLLPQGKTGSKSSRQRSKLVLSHRRPKNKRLTRPRARCTPCA